MSPVVVLCRSVQHWSCSPALPTGTFDCKASPVGAAKTWDSFEARRPSAPHSHHTALAPQLTRLVVGKPSMLTPDQTPCWETVDQSDDRRSPRSQLRPWQCQSGGHDLQSVSISSKGIGEHLSRKRPGTNTDGGKFYQFIDRIFALQWLLLKSPGLPFCVQKLDLNSHTKRSCWSGT